MTDGPLGKIGVAATTLYASDFEVSVAWYGDVLGLTPIMVGTDGHPYATFHVGGGLIVLEPVEAALEAAPPGAESTTINLVVDRDAHEIRADLLAKGVTCSEVVDSPGYHSFLFTDPDGNRFYAAQPATQAD